MGLYEILEKEKYIIPNYQKELHFLDVVQLLYNYCGCSFTENSKILNLKKIIPNKKHIVLILVDGMGVNLLRHLPKNHLFNIYKKKDIKALFPTATGCVLTSLTTAKFPCETGIFGWFGYHRETNLNYYTLLGKERKTKNDLESIKDLFIHDSIMNKLKRKTLVLQPDDIVNSKFSNYIVDYDKKDGYGSYLEAVDKIKKELISDNETFTYLYIPNIDKLEHYLGPYNKNVYNELEEIQEAVNTISNYDDTVIIITADHGQVPINKTVYMDLNKYDKYFYAYPGIDMGTACFYVKDTMEEEFIKEFNHDFKNQMYLFKREEFIDKNIFGGKLEDYAMSCLGEYIGIPKRGYAFYSDYIKEEKLPKGNHSVMSEEEFIIPLIVINKN